MELLFSVGNEDRVLEEAIERAMMNALYSGIILPITSSFYFMSSFVMFLLLHSSLF